MHLNSLGASMAVSGSPSKFHREAVTFLWAVCREGVYVCVCHHYWNSWFSIVLQTIHKVHEYAYAVNSQYRVYGWCRHITYVCSCILCMLLCIRTFALFFTIWTVHVWAGVLHKNKWVQAAQCMHVTMMHDVICVYR